MYPDSFFRINKIGLTILLIASMTACKRELIKADLPAEQSVPVTVVVNQNQRGYRISPIFQGLSYETGLLAQGPGFLDENNTVLVQLIKNLGPGVLRIGGNTSDEINWIGDAEKVDSVSKRMLNTDDIDRLSAFARAIHWPVIFGLNLGNNDAVAAANEALYVHSKLQENLFAFQSGNEPDVFKLRLRSPNYNYDQYQREWNTYFSGVKKLVPYARFAGPDMDPFNPGWFNSFAVNEHKNVRLLDGHYYDCGPASDPSINYHNILKPNKKLDGYLVQLNKISSSYRLPFRVSECNSVWGGGKPGVSDTFASSLWALDYMWTVAGNNGQGINFHGGSSRFAYTPIAIESANAVARPEYYAMLAFKYASTSGMIIPATITDPRDYNNCSAYACANADNTYSITLINKETYKNFSFTIQLSKTASSVKIARLTAPAITAKEGVTFAGNAVNADGTFTPGNIEQYTTNSKNIVISVPAGSAAVVTVQ